MRIGYTTTRTNCSLTDFESYEMCADRSLIDYHIDLYKNFAGPHETVTFVGFDRFSPNNWNGTRANKTMLGALAQGLIDAVAVTLIITPPRADVLSFTTPTMFDKLCFYIQRPKIQAAVDNNWFFLTPFSKLAWICMLVAFLITSTASRLIRTKLKFYKKFQNYKNCNKLFTVLGIFGAIYVSTLRAVMTESGHLQATFSTIDELAELVFNKKVTLITENTNFINETINTAKDFKNLQEALKTNPLLDASSISTTPGSRLESCKLVAKHPEYVLAELQHNFFAFCPASARKAVFEVCPENAISMLGAFGFPKRSRLREKLTRITEVLFTRLYAEESHFYREQYVASLTDNLVKKYAIQLANTKYVFALLAIGLTMATIAFIAELELDRHTHC